jgi:hypothetical protein
MAGRFFGKVQRGEVDERGYYSFNDKLFLRSNVSPAGTAFVFLLCGAMLHLVELSCLLEDKIFYLKAKVFRPRFVSRRG